MPVKSTASPTDRTPQQEREAGLNKAYAAANSRLRTAHQDEFNGYYQEEAAKLGIEWSPKPTPEQKAETEMRALLDTYPHLSALLREESGDGVAPTG